MICFNTVYNSICFGCVKKRFIETFLLRPKNLCLIEKTSDTHLCGYFSLYFELLIIRNKTSGLTAFILAIQNSVASAFSSQTTTSLNKIPSKESLSASSRELHRLSKALALSVTLAANIGEIAALTCSKRNDILVCIIILLYLCAHF